MDAQQLAEAIVQATAVQVDPSATAQRRAEAVQFFEQVGVFTQSFAMPISTMGACYSSLASFLTMQLKQADPSVLCAHCNAAQARRDPLHRTCSSCFDRHSVCVGSPDVGVYASADPGKQTVNSLPRADALCQLTEATKAPASTKQLPLHLIDIFLNPSPAAVHTA